ncbi:NUDIX domain-containing protein [Lentilactobacillus fungorum]|uniref:NUDIX domain-containing protein n=1 Tax=Lentilactobacillus fungorum TaxID=2201250 RepID=A0ABQ3VZA0_9LACO|nr:NUDIX hydrolase [Lentilactobacillus fungorum]GHP14053.1 NUDIX domain-containing protein [Lentilactobacillus fungorum]
MTKNYIKQIREKIGHDPLILTFAGGILVNENNEVLLQKRSDFNAWGLPGGALEFGESAMDACVREFLEETGLKVKIESLLGISTNYIEHYPNGDVSQSVVIEFIVRLVGKETTKLSSETIKLGYFGKDNLPRVFNEQHKMSIRNYYAGNYPYCD